MNVNDSTHAVVKRLAAGFAGILIAILIAGCNRSPDPRVMEAGILKDLNEQFARESTKLKAQSVVLVKESANKFTGMVKFDEGGQTKVSVTTDGQRYIWELDKEGLSQLVMAQAVKAMTNEMLEPAIARAKSKRSMADMRSLGTSCEAYAVDFNKYPLAGDLDGLAGLVVPTYIRKLPMVDGWDTPFRYVVDSGQQHYRLVSAGSGKGLEPGVLDLAVPIRTGGTPGTNRNIVFQDGQFVQYPDFIDNP